MERDVFEVRTADNVGIGYDTAGMGSRLLALIVDLLPIALLTFCADLLLAALVSSAGVGVLLILGAVPFFVLVGYFVLAETVMAGRTPGKRAVGLRVVRRDGGSPGFQEALVRGLVRVVDLPFGWMPMFFHPQSRRFGDLAAGTLVVHERRAPAPLPAPPPGRQAWPSPLAAAAPAPGDAGLGAAGLGAREYAVLRAFLSRGGLPPEQRRRLAATLAGRLLDRLGVPAGAAERQLPPEVLLERLYAELGARLGARSP